MSALRLWKGREEKSKAFVEDGEDEVIEVRGFGKDVNDVFSGDDVGNGDVRRGRGGGRGVLREFIERDDGFVSFFADECEGRASNDTPLGECGDREGETAKDGRESGDGANDEDFSDELRDDGEDVGSEGVDESAEGVTLTGDKSFERVSGSRDKGVKGGNTGLVSGFSGFDSDGDVGGEAFERVEERREPTGSAVEFCRDFGDEAFSASELGVELSEFRGGEGEGGKVEGINEGSEGVEFFRILIEEARGSGGGEQSALVLASKLCVTRNRLIQRRSNGCR